MAVANLKNTNHENMDKSSLKACLFVFLVLSLESVLASVAFKTVLNVLFYLLPFRLLVWGSIINYSLTEKKLPHGLWYLAISMPYALTWLFASEFVYPLELGKISYYCGMFFTVFYVGFVELYLKTESLSVCLDTACCLSVILVSILTAFFYENMVSFWYALFLPYLKFFESYGLQTSQSQLLNLSTHAAGIMTSSVLVNYLLVPTFISSVLVFYYRYGKKEGAHLSEWLNLRMSWCSFYFVLPVFFLSYGVILLSQVYPKMEILMTLKSAFGFFELVRFVPCLCGFSYIHFLISKKYVGSSKKLIVVSSLLAFVFYAFGYFLYPVCSFIGLIDRIVDLRKPKQVKKSLINSI